MLAIRKSDIDELLQKAADSPRRRANLNVHSEGDDLNFFYNALMPNTYVQPHRHEDKDEYFQIVEGRIIVVIFNDDGSVRQAEILGKDEVVSCRIEPGEWHTILVLQKSVLLEVKSGVYDPETSKGFAPWTPGEEEPESDAYMTTLWQTVQRLPRIT